MLQNIKAIKLIYFIVTKAVFKRMRGITCAGYFIKYIFLFFAGEQLFQFE